MDPITIIVGVVTLLVGAVITFFVLKNTDVAKSKSIIDDAKKEAERIKKRKDITSQRKIYRVKIST